MIFILKNIKDIMQSKEGDILCKRSVIYSRRPSHWSPSWSSGYHRASTHRKAPEPLDGLRWQDPVPLCPGYYRPRDSSPSDGYVRDGGFADTHFHGNRRDHWWRQGLAVPFVGSSVPHRLFGLHPRQSAWQRGAGQGRISALGINLRGEKELLGLWIAKTEGA